MSVHDLTLSLDDGRISDKDSASSTFERRSASVVGRESPYQSVVSPSFQTKSTTGRVVSPVLPTSIPIERVASSTASTKESSIQRGLSPSIESNSPTETDASPVPVTSIPIQRLQSPTESSIEGNHKNYSNSLIERNRSSSIMSKTLHSSFEKCPSSGISIPIHRESMSAVTNRSTMSRSNFATLEKQQMEDCSRESSISSCLSPSNMSIPVYKENNISSSDKEFLSESQPSRKNSKTPLPAKYFSMERSNSPLPREKSPLTCRGSQMLKVRSPMNTKLTEPESASVNYEKRSSVVSRESILQRRISKFTSSSASPSVQALRSKLEIQTQGHRNSSPEKINIFESELSKLESATSMLNSALPRKTSESSSIGSNRQSFVEIVANQFEDYHQNNQMKQNILNKSLEENDFTLSNNGQNIDGLSKTGAVLQIPILDEIRQDSPLLPIETPTIKDYDFQMKNKDSDIIGNSKSSDEKLATNTLKKEEKPSSYTESNNEAIKSLSSIGNSSNVDKNQIISKIKSSNDCNISLEHATDQCNDMSGQASVDPSDSVIEAPPLPPKKAPMKFLYTPQNKTSTHDPSSTELMTLSNNKKQSQKNQKSFTNDFDTLSQDCYRALAASRKAAENLENLMATNSFTSNGSNDSESVNPVAKEVIDTLNSQGSNNKMMPIDKEVTLEEINDYVNILSPSCSNDAANQYSKLKEDQNNLTEKYAAATIQDEIYRESNNDLDKKKCMANFGENTEKDNKTKPKPDIIGNNVAMINDEIEKDDVQIIFKNNNDNFNEIVDNNSKEKVTGELANNMVAVTETMTRLYDNKGEIIDDKDAHPVEATVDKFRVDSDIDEIIENHGALKSNSTSESNVQTVNVQTVNSGENVANNYTTVGFNVEKEAGGRLNTETGEDKRSAAGVTQSAGGQQQLNYVSTFFYCFLESLFNVI